MTRRWLVVIEDPRSELVNEDEAAVYIEALIDEANSGLRVARVQRGGLLADKVMAELPSVRHRDMGRARG